MNLLPFTLVYGIPTPQDRALPIRHALEEPVLKLRLRFRDNEWAKAYVRTPTGIRRFHIAKYADCLELAKETGANR